jgi:glycosyltransferase involved in cell wall biosynthesis
MKLLIIVPAYNEAESIVKVIEELQEKVPQFDYIIVNDGSKDNTAGICREHGFRMLDLPVNLGLTGAFQTGMRYGFEKGYDAAIQIDADGQHDPAYIPEMVQIMEEKGADLVIGSRFVSEKKPKTLRMIGNTIIEAAIRLTTGKKLTDPTSGMRLYNRKLIRELAYGVNYSPEPDTVAYLLRCGAQVEETQVTVRERETGESYLSMGRSIRYMTLMCMNILFIQWVRKRSETV